MSLISLQTLKKQASETLWCCSLLMIIRRLSLCGYHHHNMPTASFATACLFAADLCDIVRAVLLALLLALLVSVPVVLGIHAHHPPPLLVLSSSSPCASSPPTTTTTMIRFAPILEHSILPLCMAFLWRYYFSMVMRETLRTVAVISERGDCAVRLFRLAVRTLVDAVQIVEGTSLLASFVFIVLSVFASVLCVLFVVPLSDDPLHAFIGGLHFSCCFGTFYFMAKGVSSLCGFVLQPFRRLANDDTTATTNLPRGDNDAFYRHYYYPHCYPSAAAAPAATAAAAHPKRE